MANPDDQIKWNMKMMTLVETPAQTERIDPIETLRWPFGPSKLHQNLQSHNSTQTPLSQEESFPEVLTFL